MSEFGGISNDSSILVTNTTDIDLTISDVVNSLTETIVLGSMDNEQHNLQLSKNMVVFDGALIFSGLLTTEHIKNLTFGLFGVKDTTGSDVPDDMYVRSYTVKSRVSADIVTDPDYITTTRDVISNTNGLLDLVSEEYVTTDSTLTTIPSDEHTPIVTFYLDGRGTDTPPPPYPEYNTVEIPYFQIGMDGGAVGVQVDGGFTSSEVLVPDFTHRQNRIVASTELTINEAIYDIADLQISNIIVNNPRHNKFHIFDSYKIDPSLSDDEYRFLDVSMESNTISVPVKFNTNNWNADKNGIDYSGNSMELLDYSGGYGTAIDGEQNIWIADYELDVIYKYDSSGEAIALDNGQSYDYIDFRDLGFTIPYYGYDADLDAEYTQYTWLGPNDITIDADNNIYVSMYTTPYVAKFTKLGVFLELIISSEYNDAFMVNDFPDEMAVPKVTAIEALDTDIVAIAYDGGTTSAYISVLNGAVESNQITFDDINTQITGIIPSADDPINLNKFYISVSSDISVDIGGVGGVYEIIYDGVSVITSTLIPLDVVGEYIALDDISHMTIDGNKSLWVCHGYNNVSVYQLVGGVYSKFGDTMEVETSEATYNGNYVLNPEFETDPLVDEYILRYKGVNVFGGISYDLSGWITILQGFDNVIVRTDVDNFMDNAMTETSSYLLYFSEETTNYGTWIVSDFTSQPSYVTATAPFKSMQANGDWSGVYWSYKYGSIDIEIPDNVYTGLTLNAESSTFSITSVNGDDLLLTRKGETISMIDQLKSYVLQEPLSQYETLWDDLMYNIVGDEDSVYQTFGKQFYEKITNFVQNHVDVDTANVRQFYSDNNMLGNDIIDYDYNYPPDISRLMDIVSIQYSRLVGSRRTCNRNYSQDRRYTQADQAEDYENISFKDVLCPNCGSHHPSNLGLARLIAGDDGVTVDAFVEYADDSLITFNDANGHVIYMEVGVELYRMQEGVPIVIRDTFTTTKREYEIFYPTAEMDGQYLSFLDTLNIGFRIPFVQNYQVYDYIDLTSKTIQDDGVLSLDSDNTDQAILDINDIDDWFESGGKVEALFAATLSNILGVESTTSEDLITVPSAALIVSMINITTEVYDAINASTILNVPVVIDERDDTYLTLFDYYDDTLTTDNKILELASYNSTAITDPSTKYLKVYIYGLPLYVQIRTSTDTFIGSSSVIDAIFESATIASDELELYEINKAIGVRFNGNIYYMPLYIGNE